MQCSLYRKITSLVLTFALLTVVFPMTVLADEAEGDAAISAQENVVDIEGTSEIDPEVTGQDDTDVDTESKDEQLAADDDGQQVVKELDREVATDEGGQDASALSTSDPVDDEVVLELQAGASKVLSVGESFNGVTGTSLSVEDEYSFTTTHQMKVRVTIDWNTTTTTKYPSSYVEVFGSYQRTTFNTGHFEYEKVLSAGTHTFSFATDAGVAYTGKIEDVSVYATSITAENVVVNVDDFALVQPMLNPESVTCSEIKLAVANEKIARIEYDNMVEGVSVGVTSLIITDTISGVSTTVKLTVNPERVYAEYSGCTAQLYLGLPSEGYIDSGSIVTYEFTLARPTKISLTLTWEESSGYSQDLTLYAFDTYGDDTMNGDYYLDYDRHAYRTTRKLSAGHHVVRIGGYGTSYTLLLKDANAYAKAISIPKLRLGVGASVQVKPTFTPAKVDGSNLSYKSDNSAVARVSSTGRVVGVSAGTTTIRVTDSLGKASTTFKVEVSGSAALTGRKGSAKVSVGLLGSKKMTYASTSPNPALTWKSSKPKVASVDVDGVVKANKAGKTTVSATDRFGHTVKWTITVPKVKAKKIKIAKIANQKYTGKAKKPTPTIKYAGHKLKKGTDYTLAYAKNKNVGTATLTVKFKGSYTGKVVKKFKIVAPKVGKPHITYWYHGSYWSRIEFDSGSNATGTQLRIVGGGGPTYDKHIKGGSGEGWCEKGYANARVKFMIRSYKTVGGKKFYSAWVTKVL